MEVLSNSSVLSMEQQSTLANSVSTKAYGNLVVLGKDNLPKYPHIVTESEIIIGREKDSDIRIKLASVSRHQCKIFIDENDQVSLVNLSTTNFTLINGEPLYSTDIAVALKNGDVISVAERSLVFYSSTLNNIFTILYHALIYIFR